MARPQKMALDYFPLDVDIFSSKKTVSLRSRFGGRGMAVFLAVLCRIYGDKGYYVMEDEDLLASVALDTRSSLDLVKNILEQLIAGALLTRIPFAGGQALTSHGVQLRYQEAVKRRTAVFVEEELWVLTPQETAGFLLFTQKEKMPKNKGLGQEETRFLDTKTLQRKEKEKKKREAESQFRPESFAYRAAAYLAQEVEKNFPKQKVPKTEEQMQAWAREMDKMVRLDGLTEEEVRAVMKFALTDDFWSINIRSAASLRKHGLDLLARVSRKKGQKEAVKGNRAFETEERLAAKRAAMGLEEG